MSEQRTPAQPEKKSYEKPAVIHRQVMETVAGACSDADMKNGKTGVGDSCTNPNS